MECVTKKHCFQWPLLLHQHVHGHLRGREESNSGLDESGKNAADSFKWSSRKIKNYRYEDKLLLSTS